MTTTELQSAEMSQHLQTPPKGSLRVMTFNIRHGKGLNGKVSLRPIAAEIRRSGADVVALQEVDRFHPRSGFRDQIRKLGRMLDMEWCFAPSLKFGYSEYGNAFLSSFPILRRSVEYMRGLQERRSILQIVISAGKKPLRLFNTHLGVLAADRQRQFNWMMRSLEKNEPPLLLMGDFNMAHNDPLMEQLAGKWWKIALGRQEGTIQGGGEIDHIFIRLSDHDHGIKVKLAAEKLRARTQPTTASDHYPVLADIPWSMLQ